MNYSHDDYNSRLKILTCLRHWMIISFQHLQLLHPWRLSLLSLYFYNNCTRIMSWLAGLSAKEDPIVSCITHSLVFLCEQWHHSAGEKAVQLNKEPINNMASKNLDWSVEETQQLNIFWVDWGTGKQTHRLHYCLVSSQPYEGGRGNPLPPLASMAITHSRLEQSDLGANVKKT